jgi:hypothetical protein
MGVAKTIRWKTATGLFLGDGRVVCTTVGFTPKGVQELHSETIPLDGTTLAECLAKLAEDKKLLGEIVCGVGSRRFFLVTSPPPDLEGDEELVDVLAGGLARLSGGLVHGVTPLRLPSGAMISFTACSGGTARKALEGLTGVKENRLRLTGVPLALYTMACQNPKPIRKLACEVRLFLGDGEGMAVLAHAGNPIGLHLFDCPAAQVVPSIGRAVRTLVARARDSLGLSGVDVVYLHVGEDQTDLVQQCEDFSGVNIKLGPELPMNDHTSSLALAMVGMRPKKGLINLFDEVFEPAGFMKNFPIVSTIFLLGLLATNWLVLSSAESELRAEAKGHRKKASANYTSVGISKGELEGRHEVLKAEYKLAEYFITNRVYWSAILQDLPHIVPDSMTVEDFSGRDTVNFPRKKQKAANVLSKLRQVSITGVAPVAEGVTSPPELDLLIAAVRDAESISELMPSINNSNVRLSSGVNGTLARILITSAP